MVTAILLTFCCAVNTGEAVSPELHARCLSALHEALADGKEFVKVHAAESLIWTGNAGNVRELFLDEPITAPRYRIGVWRVLAQAAPNPRERQEYENKILAVLLDPNASDRTHAAETSGKLGVTSHAPEVLLLAKGEAGSCQAMAQWVLANSGEEKDEACLAELLESPNNDARGCAAYALRFFKKIRPATYEKLKTAAEKEPVGSPQRSNMISPWYLHSTLGERPDVRTRLMQCTETGRSEDKREVCAALGRMPNPEDIPFLTKLLADADLDVRAGAAEAILRIEISQKPCDVERAIAGNGAWADAAFAATTSSGSTASADTAPGLRIIREDAVGDTKLGRCSFGGPMRLGGKVYEHGIGVNSHSILRVTPGKPASRFVCDIGLDRNVDNTPASVRFHVVVDGRDAFATDVVRPKDGMRGIDVALNGARVFDLVVDEGGDDRSYDQADWADGRVVFEDGSEAWLDDLAREATVATDLPFSFVYGGRSSRELIGKWNRNVQDEPVKDGSQVRTLAFSDPDTGLEVRAVSIRYADTPGVEWTLHFTNKGTEDTPILEEVSALDVLITPGMGSPAVLHRLNGGPCAADDWLPFDEAVPPGGKVAFAATNGRSSNVSPFFNLDWGGGGVIVGIGWSGQWQASVEQANGRIRVRAGMQNLQTKLHPGETLRGPRIMQLYWTGGDAARSYNLWRRTILAHVAPKVDGKTATPPIAHLSDAFYEMNATNETVALSHLDAVKDLGFEIFWMDAYFTRDGFPAGMGHYGFPIDRVIPHDRFPNGIKPISEAIHASGMGFLMWFEPERVAPNTELAKEHPEWVISLDNSGGGLFNLGIPEARQYMTDYLNAVVSEYGLDWLRIDYNIDPLPYWEHLNAKEPDRRGMAEIRYVEGLYRMWDDIRAANPRLLIDDCASGGRRIDMETISRSIPLWRTDATIGPLMNNDFNQAAMQNQLMTAGLSRYVPFSASGQMGAAPYLFRSGFNGGISFAEDCRPKDYPREQLKQAIAEGKRIRKYFFGDYYPLSDITMSPKDWCVLQYNRPAERDGMIVAYRRPTSPYGAFQCELRDIELNAEYEVTLYQTYEAAEPIRMKGFQFAHFQAEIPARPGSLLVEYKALN